MVRLAAAGIFLLAALLTIGALRASPTDQSTTPVPAGGSPAQSANTTTGQSGTTQPSFGGGTFLGTTTPPGAAQTFLGVPTVSPTTTTSPAPAQPTTTTTGAAAIGEAALPFLPYTVVYASPFAYQAGTGGQMMVPVAGFVPQTAAPGMSAATAPAAPGAVGTSGRYGTAAGQPVEALGRAAAKPSVSDDVLLRAAQERLRTQAGYSESSVSVEVQRGIVIVNTRGLAPRERDRVMAIARDIRGSLGVLVRSR